MEGEELPPVGVFWVEPEAMDGLGKQEDCVEIFSVVVVLGDRLVSDVLLLVAEVNGDCHC